MSTTLERGIAHGCDSYRVLTMAEELSVEQKHGKSRVRVARVWRNVASGGGGDLIVEWNVSISLFSDCVPAYTQGDNSAIVATDTIKNTVYVKAKECWDVVSMEEFAVVLGKHFTTFYDQVTDAVIKIDEKPWERVVVDGQPHQHGFKLGSEKHTTEVTVKKCGALQIKSGLEGLALLKTTKSGFEGYFVDQFTTLPKTRDRMLATELTASWRYQFKHLSDVSSKPFCFTKRYHDVKETLADTFFGSPRVGVYSPSVQSTLYLMAKAALNRFPEIESVQLRMPNLHFLPVNLSKNNQTIVKFADDVYLPTSEPHGTIEATISRSHTVSKL